MQQRLKERATGQRVGQPRRYILSGLLVCERCGSRLVVTSKPSRYACGTFLYGGRAACGVDATARREEVEAAILEPVRSALLCDEAVDRFCSLIQELHQREHEQAARGVSPAAAAIGAEIADLESLITERPARAATLRATIEDLRQKQANLQRAAWRRTAAPDVALPAEEAYRGAVADINGALKGNNVEAARAALRGLLGNIPVFQQGRHLAARLTMNPASLLSNPGIVLLVGSGGRTYHQQIKMCRRY